MTSLASSAATFNLAILPSTVSASAAANPAKLRRSSPKILLKSFVASMSLSSPTPNFCNDTKLPSTALLTAFATLPKSFCVAFAILTEMSRRSKAVLTSPVLLAIRDKAGLKRSSDTPVKRCILSICASAAVTTASDAPAEFLSESARILCAFSSASAFLTETCANLIDAAERAAYAAIPVLEIAPSTPPNFSVDFVALLIPLSFNLVIN